MQRGGRFATTIDANPYGKRRAPGRDGSSIPQAQTLPEGITLEVRAGSGGLLLRYGLHKALDVSVVLYDMQGRTVARKDLGLQPAGYHEQQVGLETAARGAYSAVLEAGGSRSSRVVVRR